MKRTTIIKCIFDDYVKKAVDVLTAYIGIVLSAPVITTHVIFNWPSNLKTSDFNMWTFGHILVTYLLSHIAYQLFHLSFVNSALVGFGIMYLWEFLIDANGLSDYSFSTQDIGADALGSIMFVLVMLLGGVS